MKNVQKKYDFAVIAVDTVIFTVRDNALQILLMKMKKDPYQNCWAIPGGLVQPDESVDTAAVRHLKEKTGVDSVYLEQLYTFGKVDRDPFGRVVSVAYYALVPSNSIHLKKQRQGPEVTFFPVKKVPQLAYDHATILDTAVNRVKAKLAYTNIVYSLLQKEFTLRDLQQTYEIILGKKLDKRNFRKKIFALDLVRKTGRSERGAANRPAELFSFKSTKAQIVAVL